MPEPLDPQDLYPGVHTPEELARARKFNAEQEARWARLAAEERDRRVRERAEKEARGETLVDQLRLAFAARPFVPLKIRVAGEEFVWRADDPDLATLRFLDDAVMWFHDGKKVVVRLSAITTFEELPSEMRR